MLNDVLVADANPPVLSIAVICKPVVGVYRRVTFGNVAMPLTSVAVAIVVPPHDGIVSVITLLLSPVTIWL